MFTCAGWQRRLFFLRRFVMLSPFGECFIRYAILALLVRADFNWVSKVISRLLWFCFPSLLDWQEKHAPPSQPIRSKTKTNRALVARVFPRLASVTCICFDFWLVHCVIYICCDKSELSLWFWFDDTLMKFAQQIKLNVHQVVVYDMNSKGLNFYHVSAISINFVLFPSLKFTRQDRKVVWAAVNIVIRL